MRYVTTRTPLISLFACCARGTSPFERARSLARNKEQAVHPGLPCDAVLKAMEQASAGFGFFNWLVPAFCMTLLVI
jgi:hypothetical protein